MSSYLQARVHEVRDDRPVRLVTLGPHESRRDRADCTVSLGTGSGSHPIDNTNRGDAERKDMTVTNDVVRRDPFAAMEGFSPFRRVFDRVFDDPFFRTAGFGAASDEGTLALDLYEKDGALKVEASLPGYKKEDIDVQVHDGILSIKAQRSAETEEGERGSKFYRRERSWGSVSRRVALPGIVKDATVDAELKNGVLTLSIPLPEKAQPKQIEIKGE